MMAPINEGLLVHWRHFDAAVNVMLNADFATALTVISQAARLRPELTEAQMSLPDFAQFILGTVMVSRAFEAGETDDMGVWLQLALTDAPTDAHRHRVYIGRVGTFYANPIVFTWPRFHETMVSYFCALYEYARRLTAYRDICEDLLPLALRTFRYAMSRPNQLITNNDLQLGSSMLTWMAKERPDLAPELALDFESYATAGRLAKRQRYSFVLTLSTAGGEFSSHGSLYWAHHALSRLNAHASQMDRAQLRSALMRTDQNGPADAAAVIAQMEIVRFQRSIGKTPLQVAREALYATDLVLPFFVKVIGMGRADLILRGLQTWFRQGSEGDAPESDHLLISLPFGRTKSSILCEGNLIELERVTLTPLVRVSRAMNTFLQTYATVAGVDNSGLEFPERPGHPEEFPDDLAEALGEAYCPAGVEVPGAPTAQLVLPTEGHPIQAAQLMNWGRTWPIASSLARPRRDRDVRKVLLWGGGDAFSASMELDMVEHFLTRAGVQTVRPDPQTYTRELFLDLYSDPTFDVVWIASHGQFDHWKPHQVQLELARHLPSVGLDELWQIAPDTGERRLLFLNVCDGARFVDPSLLPRIGLAPGLAAGCQAAISHLWPVRLYPSAAFGALLAHAIAGGTGFFAAYVSALQGLQKRTSELAADLEHLCGVTVDGRRFDLVERLERQDDDFSRIEAWGSAAFFQ